MDARAKAKAAAKAAVEALVHAETRAWDTQDAEALVDLFHPDMVWPWPPNPQGHDPMTWSIGMGRFDRARWKRSWEGLFATQRLIHNRRELKKVEVSEEGDAGFAVVDIDTLWRDGAGNDNHWKGRVSKTYTRMADGQWKLIMHTGVLVY
jgi:ketosteroid isomerase-like protein